MRVPFTHLHCHSDASLLDGLGPVDRLVRAAASKGFKSLALTDHGTLANAVAFTQVCQDYGVKPILGVEGYINYAEDVGHITLLADGQKGFESLVKLQNSAHASSPGKRRPAFSLDQLRINSEDLVCLSGCVSSPANWLTFREAKKYVAILKNIFGPRFFMELMFISDTDTWSRPIALADAIDAKLVITNDIHFPYQTDSKTHPILTSVKAGMTYHSKELWLKNGRQILARAKRFADEDLVVDAIRRAYKIGRKLKAVDLAREPSLPHIKKADEKLEALAQKCLKEKGYAKKHAYRHRVNEELRIIRSMGYSTYFLILNDIIHWGRNNNVRVGPGRGSGAGSLLLYLLDVTYVNPLTYDLSFERFLHEHRKGFPDVDIDFDMEGRRKVIEYAKEKWGAVPIVTYSRYNHASLVHDLAKILKLSREIEIEAAEKGYESEAFKRLNEENSLFGSSYEIMLGQIRHRSKHAGGVIISDSVVPIEKVGGTFVAAWTDGMHRQLSYAGIIKFDFLGLTALSALKRMEDETGKSPATPGECEKTLESFRSGNLVGIFQFSGSSGIAELTRKVAPTGFDDLVAINALYRPGALDVGSADAYPGWKASPRSLDPLIDDILEPTYGAIVFQEQVMDIYARVTGGSLAEADMARRAIIKSKVGDPEWERVVAEAQQNFMAGAKRSGLKKPIARRIWKELFSHIRYSFNRAHAVSYCLISWEMAWWKTHYPVHFYAAMMDLDPTAFQTYLFDAAEHDIEVVRPHVNVSSTQFEHRDEVIYLPFSQIKFLGKPGAEAIVRAREVAEFTSFKDFGERVPRRKVTSRARLGLYAIGGFEGLKGNPIDAGIDTTKLTMGAPASELQREFLGAIFPSAEMLRRINIHRQKDKHVAGIIASVKDKVSKWGPYRVYRLVPNGVFWVRDGPSYEIGEIVAVKVNQRTGKALKVKKL